MMTTLYGHASMICLGTLNTSGMSVLREEEAAGVSACAESLRTTLTVMIFRFTEAEFSQTMRLTGGFTGGRELSEDEARQLYNNGYGRGR
jgi:hypothetical protein